jgi:hypothetical protein
MPLDDFDDVFFTAEDATPPNRRKRHASRAGRLGPLPGPYVRVPIEWLPRFGVRARLLLYLLYRSHWGQRDVALTKRALAEIGAPRSTLYSALGALEREGQIAVERHTGRALTTRPIVTRA